jgi:hypothetical protein
MNLFGIKDKLSSLASDVFNHSAHTVLSTASTGLAFGFVGAVVGFGLGIADEVLLYNNITSHHYLTYSALAASTVGLFGASILKSGFFMEIMETTLIHSAVSSYIDQHDKELVLIEGLTTNSVTEY